MNKPRCILHIGSHKTGTSAIQKILATHTDSLYNDGYVYSKSCKHHCDHSSNPIPIAILSDDRALLESYLNALDHEIKENPAHDFIISSEMLEKCPLLHKHSDLFSVFVDFLESKFESVDIIVSLRDPYGHANSYFKQLVSSHTHPFKNTIDHYLNHVFLRTPTPIEIYNGWKNSIHKLNKYYVYWYNKSLLDNYQCLQKAMGLSFDYDDPGLVNKSIDGIFLSLNYFYNLHLMQDGQFIHELKKCATRCKDSSLYYKTSIINEDQILMFKDASSKYLIVPPDAVVLNDIVLENTKDYADMPIIQNEEEFWTILKKIQNIFPGELKL